MKTRKIHGPLCNLGLNKDIILTYTYAPFRSGPSWGGGRSLKRFVHGVKVESHASSYEKIPATTWNILKCIE
jgi:hypothetical protein